MLYNQLEKVDHSPLLWAVIHSPLDANQVHKAHLCIYPYTTDIINRKLYRPIKNKDVMLDSRLIRKLHQIRSLM